MGKVLTSGGAPAPRQEFIDPVDGMTVGHSREYVGDPCLRIDLVEFGGCDQGADGCPAVSATVGAREERVLAVEGDRADGAFDRAGVETDPAVIEEPAEHVPAGERVADRLRQTASSSLRFSSLTRGIDTSFVTDCAVNNRSHLPQIPQMCQKWTLTRKSFLVADIFSSGYHYTPIICLGYPRARHCIYAHFLAVHA